MCWGQGREPAPAQERRVQPRMGGLRTTEGVPRSWRRLAGLPWPRNAALRMAVPFAHQSWDIFNPELCQGAPRTEPGSLPHRWPGQGTSTPGLRVSLTWGHLANCPPGGYSQASWCRPHWQGHLLLGYSGGLCWLRAGLWTQARVSVCVCKCVHVRTCPRVSMSESMCVCICDSTCVCVHV